MARNKLLFKSCQQINFEITFVKSKSSTQHLTFGADERQHKKSSYCKNNMSKIKK